MTGGGDPFEPGTTSLLAVVSLGIGTLSGRSCVGIVMGAHRHSGGFLEAPKEKVPRSDRKSIVPLQLTSRQLSSVVAQATERAKAVSQGTCGIFINECENNDPPPAPTGRCAFNYHLSIAKPTLANHE